MRARMKKRKKETEKEAEEENGRERTGEEENPSRYTASPLSTRHAATRSLSASWFPVPRFADLKPCR